MKNRILFLNTVLFIVFLGGLSFQNKINAQAKCKAGISDKTNMPPNPENKPNGIFYFDYKIISDITHRNKNGEITQINNLKYYVNSEDGSIFFPKDAVPGNVLQSLTGYSSMKNDDEEFSGAVFFPNGKLVLYMKKEYVEGNKKRAVILPLPKDANEIVVENFRRMTKFFNDIADKVAPQDDLEPLPGASKWNEISVGYTAQIQVGYNKYAKQTMYIDLEPTTVTTGIGMVGFMVGVVKDWRIANCNRLAVFNKIEHDDGSFIQAELISMIKEKKSFNATSYQPEQVPGTGISILNGDAELKERGRRMTDFAIRKKELIQKLQDLTEKKAQCTKSGRKRASCDALYDPKIKEIEEKMKQLNKDLMQNLGVEDLIRNN